MNKKVVRILIVFLVLISISTMCYAGFKEVNISEEIPMSFFQRIKILFSYVIGSLLSGLLFLNRVHYGFFGIRLDYYIIVGITLLYTILNFLIVRKKKELAKISLKVNSIILLILLLISTLNVSNIINIYELIFVILTLLIISLIFQKVILKKDDEKLKKHNHILKIIMVVLIIIEFVISVIAYTFMFLIPKFDFQEILTGEVSFYEYMYGEIDSSEPILVELLYEHTSPWYPTSYNGSKYTLSKGEYVNYIGGKVLDIDNEGVLIQYTEYDYVPKETTDTVNGLDFMFNNYKMVSEEKEIKLKWDTWYREIESRNPSGFYDGDTDTYIRVIKNK